MMHHLYVCPQYSEELHRHITFRDFLRSNPEAVRKYSLTKEKAAELFPDDIDGYIEYKSPCIEEQFVRSKMPTAEMIELAREHGMVLLATPKRMYEACGILYSNGLVGNRIKNA